jgi:DNA replication protein DnaC
VQVKNELLKCGFYKRSFDFKLNWQQNEFYTNLFNDFVEQYIINGENNYGYYIFGNIGVGKTTLLASIAKFLTIFLNIKIHYITMTRLVKLITSIDFADKDKIADLETCNILFIDDLGIEKCTTDNQEAVIRDFFGYRYGNKLVNIIAGNIDIRTQQNKNSFNRQMSDYLNDSKYYKIVEMSGKSKRI